MPKGKLIALTGVSKVGKSTQAKLLYENLINKGVNAVLVREFSNSFVGRSLEHIIKENNSLNVFSETLQILSGNVDRLYRHILPGLDAYEVVICDTYNNMIIPYQLSRAETIEEKCLITEIVHKVNELFPQPDLIFYLTASIDVICDRFSKDTGRRSEKFRTFIENVLNEVQIKSDYVVIDANKNVNEVASYILKEVMKIL